MTLCSHIFRRAAPWCPTHHNTDISSCCGGGSRSQDLWISRARADESQLFQSSGLRPSSAQAKRSHSPTKSLLTRERITGAVLATAKYCADCGCRQGLAGVSGVAIELRKRDNGRVRVEHPNHPCAAGALSHPHHKWPRRRTWRNAKLRGDAPGVPGNARTSSVDVAKGRSHSDNTSPGSALRFFHLIHTNTVTR